MPRQFVVGAGEARRLDQAVAAVCPDLSRGAARRLIAAGWVLLNGARCRVAGRLVRGGDRVRLEEPADDVAAAALPILFEDESLVAVDKPAGMPSAPTREGAAGTALDVLREQLRRRHGRSVPLWLVHRLDAGTSGVLVFARTRSAAAKLSDLFRRRRVSKVYAAVVSGEMAGSGRIDLPIEARSGRAKIAPAGRPAATVWEVVGRQPGRTVVELRPLTGRMHQLRLHLSAVGHPVCGDRSYGGPTAPRLMLHARSLELSHPKRGAALRIDSPLPPGFAPVPPGAPKR